MVKLIIFITWLQVGCVYTYTKASGHSLDSTFYSLTLWAEILDAELASALYKRYEEARIC